MTSGGGRAGAKPGGGRSPATALLAIALGAAAIFPPRAAHARSTSALPYPTTDVWAAAVRFLRVDRSFPIRERDEKAGYVLFDYFEGNKTFHASLELVAVTDEDGRATTEVVLSVPDLPQRYELLLLAELGSKVRQERGPPPPPRPRPAPAEAPKDKDVPRPHAEPDAGLPRAPTIPTP